MDNVVDTNSVQHSNTSLESHSNEIDPTEESIVHLINKINKSISQSYFNDLIDEDDAADIREYTLTVCNKYVIEKKVKASLFGVAYRVAKYRASKIAKRKIKERELLKKEGKKFVEYSDKIHSLKNETQEDQLIDKENNSLSPGEKLENDKMFLKICINRLSEKQRTVVRLIKKGIGKTHIATLLNCSRENVYGIMGRAFRNLERCICELRELQKTN